MIDTSKLIDLDECAINALDLFKKKGIPKLEDISFNRPIVLGSSNALVAGKIIFEDTDAVFADESNFIKKLDTTKNIDGAVILSASGGKHAPIIAEELKNRKIESILFTNTENSQAGRIVDHTYIFNKNTEPYTYNTSTYLGMILSKTKENPSQIIETIESIKNIIPTDLSKYNAYFIIIPNEFENLREMLITKFDELFGPMLVGRVYTPEQTKHAKTVTESDTELFISLGYENNLFGKNRINIPLSEKFNYGTLMAVAYYIIGQIQKANPPYFKNNIERYIKESSEIFHEKLEVIVK
ncbi:MAG: hypothetical protein WCQ00_02700 [bacterium]